MALLLRNRGVKRIRPLLGGLQAWRDRGYPLETIAIATERSANFEVTN